MLDIDALCRFAYCYFKAHFHVTQDILDPEFFVGICSETCVKSDQTRQRLTLFRDINVIDPDVRVEFVELNNDVSTIMERYIFSLYFKHPSGIL